MADARCVLLVRYRRPLYDDVTVMKSCVPRTLHAERRVSLRYERSRRATRGRRFSPSRRDLSRVCFGRSGCQRHVVENEKNPLDAEVVARVCARTFRARALRGAAMGACLSAPKPETDGPSVSARSARTFGVAPVQTAKSDVESSGEMVEVPLDTPPAAASGAGKGSGFGSFLQAKVTVDARSAEDARDAPSKPSEDANGAAHRVRGALVPERGRIDQALVDDMDAAVASALEGSDDKAAEPGFSADRVASAEAEAAAAREQDVSLVLSDDPSDEETFSDSGEGDEEEDDDSDEYETDASSAEEDEGEDAHRSGSTEDATGETIEDVTEDVNEDVTEEATEEVTDDAPAIAPATAPAAIAPAAIAPPPPRTPRTTRRLQSPGRPSRPAPMRTTSRTRSAWWTWARCRTLRRPVPSTIPRRATATATATRTPRGRSLRVRRRRLGSRRRRTAPRTRRCRIRSTRTRSAIGRIGRIGRRILAPRTRRCHRGRRFPKRRKAGDVAARTTPSLRATTPIPSLRLRTIPSLPPRTATRATASTRTPGRASRPRWRRSAPPWTRR